jgi:phosphoglycolate phosphatase-like HAD superfamily hydrolase
MSLDIPRIQGICFDVDGTLSDTDDLWVSRLEKNLSPGKIFFPQRSPHSFARWAVMAMETPGNLLYWMLDFLHIDDDVGRILNKVSQKGRLRTRGPFWIIHAVKETLLALNQRYPMAVVSARDQSSTIAFLDYFELTPLFLAVATSQTCEHTKPFPDPVLWAAEKMSIPPHNLLMVGDTWVDIRAGKAAGAQTVGVLCGFGSEKSLRRAGADLIIPNTADLVDTLKMEV